MLNITGTRRNLQFVLLLQAHYFTRIISLVLSNSRFLTTKNNLEMLRTFLSRYIFIVAAASVNWVAKLQAAPNWLASESVHIYVAEDSIRSRPYPQNRQSQDMLRLLILLLSLYLCRCRLIHIFYILYVLDLVAVVAY